MTTLIYLALVALILVHLFRNPPGPDVLAWRAR